MHRFKLYLVLIFLLVSGSASSQLTADLSSPVAANRTFFEAVAQSRFDVAWRSLTLKSQQTIIDMVAEQDKIPRDQVVKFFQENQSPVQQGFWQSFQKSSRLKEVTPQLSYELKSEAGDQASVSVKIQDKEMLVSKIYRENQEWRMGYIESFMPSKASPKTPEAPAPRAASETQAPR